jgi:hypothetical protein
MSSAGDRNWTRTPGPVSDGALEDAKVERICCPQKVGRNKNQLAKFGFC